MCNLYMGAGKLDQFPWNFQRTFKTHSLYVSYPLCDTWGSIMLDGKSDQNVGDQS